MSQTADRLVTRPARQSDSWKWLKCHGHGFRDRLLVSSNFAEKCHNHDDALRLESPIKVERE